MAKTVVYRFLLSALLACVFIIGLIGSASALNYHTTSSWATQSPSRHCVAYKSVRRHGKVYRTCIRWAR